MLATVKPKNSQYFYLIASISLHSLFFGCLIYFTFFNNKEQYIRINISNKGAPSVSMVSSVANNATSPNQKKTKLKKHSYQKYQPQISKPKQEVQTQSQISAKALGTGGEAVSGSNVIPVIEDQSLLDYKAPQYPKKAIERNQQGEVIIRFLVSKDGIIKNSIIHKSSGYVLLDNSVMDMVKYWNIPRKLLQDTWVQVRVNFIIN